MGRKRLGDLLIEAGFISTEQLNFALKEQKFSREKLGQTLVRLRYITEDILIGFLGKQHGTSGIDLFKEVIDERAVDMIPRRVAEKYKVIPVGFKLEGRTKKLIVAMANPSNLEAIDTVAFITGYSIDPIFAREEHLEWIIRHYYNKRWELK